MKHCPRAPAQEGLLRSCLPDLRHELMRLAVLIDWGASGKLRSATGPGLLHPGHACKLQDMALVARWVANSYDQRLTGETSFQHKLPIAPLRAWLVRIC